MIHEVKSYEIQSLSQGAALPDRGPAFLFDSRSHKAADPIQDKQVPRVEDIEKPLVKRPPAPGLAIVSKAEQKEGEEDARQIQFTADRRPADNLKEPQEKSIDDGHLKIGSPHAGFILIITDQQKGHDHPVSRPVPPNTQKHAGADYQSADLGVLVLPLVKIAGQKTQKEGIYDAEIGPQRTANIEIEAKGNPGDQSENPHTGQVFLQIPRVDKALRYKKGHRRPCQPPDEMHDLPLPAAGWNKAPGDVINDHGQDHQVFNLISIERKRFHRAIVPQAPAEGKPI